MKRRRPGWAVIEFKFLSNSASTIIVPSLVISVQTAGNIYKLTLWKKFGILTSLLKRFSSAFQKSLGYSLSVWWRVLVLGEFSAWHGKGSCFDVGWTISRSGRLLPSRAHAVTSHDELGRSRLTWDAYYSTIPGYCKLIREELCRMASKHISLRNFRIQVTWIPGLPHALLAT